MRDTIRKCLSTETTYDTVFFYFSGHGDQRGSELYFCGTDYDANQPNQTGLSHSDIYDLCRASHPEIFVTVLDACFSGAPLIKRDSQVINFFPKDGFRSVLQFSSSMNSQTSMAGETLSEFTHAFLLGCLQKLEGTIYYSDIGGSLRDYFINNETQTPFFVNQGTGREKFVENARVLDDFRSRLKSELGISVEIANEDDLVGPDSPERGVETNDSPPSEPSIEELLQIAESKMGSEEATNEYSSSLFEAIIANSRTDDICRFFDISHECFSDYHDSSQKEFITRSLNSEKRADQLVTANISYELRERDQFYNMAAGITNALAKFNPDYKEIIHLKLNCSITNAQLVISFRPHYKILNEIKLVISIAPSLKKLYVFETVTKHLRKNWTEFDSRGQELTRRWYRVDWFDRPTLLGEKIAHDLGEKINLHISEAVSQHTEKM